MQLPGSAFSRAVTALFMLGLVLAPARAADDPAGLAVGYICSAEKVGSSAGPRTLVRTAGIGNSHLATDATPEAQSWFDYGLQLADGFYHEDAQKAFAKAAGLDPACAMCLWGQSWSRGATLNFDVSKADTKAALALARKAEKLARSPRDKAMIAALKVRYGGAPEDARTALAFAKAMDAVYREHPDPEIGVITAHAFLIPARSGESWGAERAVAILADVLRAQPEHAGAIHFYIHATEFVGRASLALPYAEKLAGLTPAASHMVHMPAHTLFRVGRYEDAAVLNARALDVEAGYRRSLSAPGALGTAAYYGHNVSFGLAGALMAGDRELALKFARHTNLAYPASVPAAESRYVRARSWMALGRFAPEEALAIPEPPKGETLLAVVRRYARGEAFAARGDASSIRAEIKALEAIKASDDNSKRMLETAKLVLTGREAMLTGDLEGAVRAYGAAAAVQDEKMRDQMDPPPWWYPIRRSLAAALLAQGRYADAQVEARRSLDVWPHDGLALKVLADAQAKAGQAAEAKAGLAEARAAYHGDLATMPAALI